MVYCPNCGKELRENAKFCSYCGTTVIVDKKSEEAAVIPEAETVIPEEEASVQETVAENNEDNSDLAEKFHEKDGLFVIKEHLSDNTESDTKNICTEVAEKKKFPWLKISVALLCVAVVGAAAYFVPAVVVPEINYNDAQELYENGSYQDAKAAFEGLDNYKESANYITKCRYGMAEQLFTEGRYSEAAEAFTALDGYSDSVARADECMVAVAEDYIASGDYDAAMSVYAEAGKADLAEQTAMKKIEALAADGEYFKAAEIAQNYCSEDVVTEYIYQGALAAKNSGDYKTAADNFYKAGKYKDSAKLAEECTYSFYIDEYTKNGASEEIVRGFYFLGNFQNSHDMFIESSYEYGLKCKENGDFSSAVAMFKNCGTYKTSISDLYNSRYNLGKLLLDSDPASARSIFALMSTYADSAAQKKTAAAKLTGAPEDWYADGFTSIGNYYTTIFRKTDTLLISCTAGTEKISAPITLTLTLRDSSGNEVSADCENVRNSGSFNGSFSLSSAASGIAEIIISRKDNGAVLRTIDITITE